ncbi:MAG: family 43 glycosylhydrolase [Sedimentisphaerales bacterium]|nr:family 43 glycosylhydrolase [Sedimentisphaerales bacterium]
MAILAMLLEVRPMAEWMCLMGCRWPAAVIALLSSAAIVFGLDGEIRIHDPSTIVRCKDRYYVFGTGRGIPILSSDDLFTWRREGRVFDRIPESVKKYVPKNDDVTVWAPDVVYHNSIYYLYYSVSAWGQFVSAVGLVTNKTLDPNDPDHQWKDRGMVVHSVEGQQLNAIDPGVICCPDGRMWLCYGSYHGNVELVELDPNTGLRIRPDSPVYIIANHSEASKIIYHDGEYYLFVNHGSCCQGVNSTYNIRVGRSAKVTGPYLDRFGQDLARGAGSLFIAAEGTQIGPGHFGPILVEDGIERFSIHYEGDLAEAGRSFLDIKPLLWTLDGWPMPGKDVEDGTYQIRSFRTGTVLQVDPNATTGSRANTARYLARDHQKWQITRIAGWYYKITSAATGLVLQAEGQGVELGQFDGRDQQLWRIDQLTDGTYRVAVKAPSQALTATAMDESTRPVALQAFANSAGQRWVITMP